MKTMTYKNETRDPIDVALLWGMGLAAFTLMLCVFMISPVLYMWIVGLTGCVALGLGSVILGGCMAGDGFMGWYFGAEIIKGGFQVVGVIFLAMLNVSCGD